MRFYIIINKKKECLTFFQLKKKQEKHQVRVQEKTLLTRK